MSEPIVFISRFRMKEGTRERFTDYARRVTPEIDAAKPRTLVYLAYLDDTATRLTIIHAFGDAQAMDVHFEGAAERAAAAYEFIEPQGWEIYGRPSQGALDVMRRSAEAAGVSLTVLPDYLVGFLHSPSAE
jgi:quinol monooxygenase YgiN